MYVIISPIQIKDGYKEQYIKAIIDDARGSVDEDPGCLRFDVIQDASDANRIWLYEVYKDAAAVEAHTQSAHCAIFRDATKDLRDEDGPQGAGEGSSNIWPPDNQWK